MANAQTSGEGAHSIAACDCAVGFYRSTPATVTCDQCPLGAECAGGTLAATLRLKNGYWRTSNASADVRACPISGTCISNVNDPAAGYCGGGLDPRVPYCTRCLGYPEVYLDVATCAPCSGARHALLGYVSAILVLLIGSRLFSRCALGAWQRRAASGVQFLRLAGRRASLAAMAKQCLGFYQIVTRLHEVFGVVLPPHFQALQRRLDVFNLNVFALPGLHLACFGFTSFTSQLLVRAAVPLLLVAAAVAYYWSRHRLADALPFALWLTFLVFSLVSSPAFQAFNCEALDDGRAYLRADYSLVCTEKDEQGRDIEQPAYAQLKVIATLIILLYPVGIPLSYAVLLFTSRRATLSTELRFLTANYQPQYFWWELVETAKRLLLASFFVLPFLGHGTLVQLFVALVVQLVFLVLQVYAAPFKQPSDNYWALTVNVM
jgi:hypothetical protein